MLKWLQIACFVVIGLNIAVWAWWNHLTDNAALIPLVFVVVGAYCGFLLRVTARDPDGFLVKTARRVSMFLTKTGPRAVLSLSAAIVTLAFLVYAIFGPTSHVPVFVHPDGDPALANSENMQFHIEVEPSDGNTIAYMSKPKSELPIPFAPFHRDNRIQITASHAEFENASDAGSLKALALRTVVLRPAAHPALVVTVHRNNHPPVSTTSFRVQAWLTGKKPSATPSNLTLDGQATFVAKSSTYWLVRIDDQTQKRVHFSPAIRIDGDRVPYTVDLEDQDAFEWRALDTPSPQDPKTLELPADAFVAALGSVPQPSSAGIAFGDMPGAIDATGFAIPYPIPVRLPSIGATSRDRVLVRRGYVVS